MKNNTPVIVEQDETLPITQDEIREQEFIRNLAVCKSRAEAARLAGYSESYITGTLYKKFKSKQFQDKIKKYYNGNAHTLLPKILEAERKVVDLVNEDVEKLPKFRHTLKEIKQTTGLLESDDKPRVPTIKIGSVKNLLLKAHDG